MIDIPILDSNIILSYVLSDISQLSAKNLKTLSEAMNRQPGSVCVPQLILMECETVFYRVMLKLNNSTKSDRDIIKDRFKAIFNLYFAEGFTHPMTWDDVDSAYKLYSKQSSVGLPKLSLIDCYLLALAKRTGMSVATFDVNLQKEAMHQHIELFTPQQ